MKINIGSKNQTKVQAVIDAIALYPNLFPNPEIKGVNVEVDLFGHPKNLHETVEGAVERAKKSFDKCDYSFGLEDGLIEVDYTLAGFMNIGVCALYDGKDIYLGLSPAFEFPKNVTELILRKETDGSQAFKKLGLTQEEKLGATKGGIIGFLTGGRTTRENQAKYAIIMALIRLDKPELYK